MTLTRNDLLNARARGSHRQIIAKSLSEAKSTRMRTAFLCHSHVDSDLAEGIQAVLKEAGWNVYIDWQDSSLPDSPNEETALAIKEKIKQCDIFLFLATKSSTTSKWCPWEIGYADSAKGVKNLIVIPINENGYQYGSEYLGLYQRAIISDTGNLAVFQPHRTDNGKLIRTF